MRRAVVLVALVSTACPRTGEQCIGPTFDDGGVIAPMAGFPAVGQRLRRFVRAPVTTCRTEVSATVEVIAPGNRPFTGTVEAVSVEFVPSTASRTLGDTATAQVSFVPDVAGVWTLNVSFDGLGTRAVEVEVLRNYEASDAGVRFSVPPSVECPFGPWVLADRQHALCEQRDASVALFTTDGDGGVSVFGGMHVAVSQDVVWQLSAAGTSLERYVWDAGLVRTDVWSGFEPFLIRGEHSRVRAVRAQSAFSLRAIDLELGVDRGSGASLEAFGDAFYSYESELGDVQIDPPLGGGNGVLALEPHAKWQQSFAFPFALVRRPVMQSTALGVPIEVPGRPEPTPNRPMERAPMWVRTDAGAVYFTIDDSGLSVSVWPNRPLLRATEDFLVFGDPASTREFELIPR